jgi:hypothetical protein
LQVATLYQRLLVRVQRAGLSHEVEQAAIFVLSVTRPGLAIFFSLPKENKVAFKLILLI